MTVCIAATTENQELVTASDHKVSTGDFSADRVTLKTDPFHNRWDAMMSATDDAALCSLIINRARDSIAGGYDSKVNLEDVISAMKGAYQTQIMARATDKYISRYGYDMETFKKTGRKELGPDVFDTICDRIARVEIDCKFLVCGYDSIDWPHIFTISNPGIEEVYDKLGFWAIGTGANAALSMLFFREQGVVTDLVNTIYNVCEAKFMAETASGVGVETFLSISNAHGVFEQPDDLQDTVRQAWRDHGRPQMPPKILDVIGDSISPPKRSASQTSKPAQ